VPRYEFRFLVRGVGQKPRLLVRIERECRDLCDAVNFANAQLQRSQPETVEQLVRIEIRVPDAGVAVPPVEVEG